MYCEMKGKKGCASIISLLLDSRLDWNGITH